MAMITNKNELLRVCALKLNNANLISNGEFQRILCDIKCMEEKDDNNNKSSNE